MSKRLKDALENEEPAVVTSASQQGASTEPKLPPRPLRYGDYTADFIRRESELIFGGDTDKLQKHTQKFINYLFVETMINHKHRLNELTIEFESMDDRVTAVLNEFKDKDEAMIQEIRTDIAHIEKQLKTLEKELGG